MPFSMELQLSTGTSLLMKKSAIIVPTAKFNYFKFMYRNHMFRTMHWTIFSLNLVNYNLKYLISNNV